MRALYRASVSLGRPYALAQYRASRIASARSTIRGIRNAHRISHTHVRRGARPARASHRKHKGGQPLKKRQNK
eukprot:353060-Rhodomonas_salina.3